MDKLNLILQQQKYKQVTCLAILKELNMELTDHLRIPVLGIEPLFTQTKNGNLPKVH